MVNLIIGIVIGAAFAPLWVKLFNMGKDFMKKDTKP